ncbi:hypothetical protein H0H81_001328 [Sphagnurus paluster]|uniref:Uncharacterized protein n=1 Tax=Sphagnurus paluster TaxID=117069 RepID=A0A9P7FMJ0_9AGAR|nr:hypothetical protein H0H81_001328 [Sphagnurus paluster]
MLAIDAARTSGFRDSLYYFRRNLLAFKLNATQPEKDYLIAEGKLGSHLRTRSVTLITARSAFKLHGSKMVIDGRWVTDDYYEQKVTEEIAALGLKPGDPVGELPDPNAASHNNEASALAAASSAPGGKADRTGGGVYRAGGPTTIFGGSGWGPYSDGPLNAVRKSLLSRDGVDEENWMFMMATRVAEAGDEWKKWRREGLRPGGGVNETIAGGGSRQVVSIVEDPVTTQVRHREEEEEDLEEEEEDADQSAGTVNGIKVEVKSATKRRRIVTEDAPPLGIYEPHTGLVYYRADSQPTQCRWEALPDSNEKKRVLGGTKVGNGAWALAWIDTIMEVGDGHVDSIKDSDARKALLSESGDTVTMPEVVDLTMDGS